MRLYSSRCLPVALRVHRGAVLMLGACAGMRQFVDTSIADEAVVSGMTVPNTTPPASAWMGDATSTVVGSSYSYPLDVSEATFKLYGEANTFTSEDANRIYASAKVQSYDPAVLFNDLRLQEVHNELLSPSKGLHGSGSGGALESGTTTFKDAEAATRAAEDGENDAVMRASRNKQGAAGAAAMAAAILDSRRAADGIALVPGHPLPVVFPRPDELPLPLRFIKKFGPGGARQTRSSKRVRPAKSATQEDVDATMYGEVMESERRVESHSFHHSIALKVQVLDEHRRPMPVKPFQHFREAADVLPARALQGLSDSGFSRPTLLQSVAIPQLMRGRDVVGVAPDGSGAKVAYAVSSIAVLVRVKAAEQEAAAAAGGSNSSTEAIQPSPSDAAAKDEASGVAHPIVVIVCTTRQTVLRTSAMYSSLAGDDVRLVAAYASEARGEEEQQRASLRSNKQCDVVVATPGRLAALLRDGAVELDRTHVLVVDQTNHIFEAEAKVDGHTALQDVERIMHAVKANKVAHQLSLWCGEMEHAVEALARRFMSPLAVTVMVTREEQTSTNVRQILYPLPSGDDRIKAIQQLYDQRTILKRDQVVVYCAYRETAEEVAKALVKALSAPSSMVRFVHSGLRARKRSEILTAFQHGDVRILVGTDVATKQLDVDELEHVIHYDLPAFAEVYMQRVNQVGRSGRQGTSHAFLTPGDTRVPSIAKFVERLTDHPLSEEIKNMVANIEATGGEDSWATPILRMRNHAVSNTKWRVRGRREMRQQVESLSGCASRSDERPLGQTI